MRGCRAVLVHAGGHSATQACPPGQGVAPTPAYLEEAVATTRTRKPAVVPAETEVVSDGMKPGADPAEDKAVSAATETGGDPTENKAVTEDTEIKAPDVAPLEPPPPPVEPAKPESPVGPEGLMPAELGDRIVDEATGEPPTDPDTVFEELPPYGYMCRSLVRLVEHVGMGAYRTPTTRLLVPAGADLKREDADRIVARLREQIA
jgi:hypothetical protein